MKLRRINKRRFVDDETGTYFEFRFDVTDAQAAEQVEMHQHCFLARYPAERWFGTDREIPVPLGRLYRKDDGGPP